MEPADTARIAGAFYLLEILTGGFAVFFVGGKLLKSADGAVTAANILSHQSLFQWGFAANLLQFACYIVVTALFYDLFKPVNQRLSLLAAFFSLAGSTIGAVSCLFYLAPLVVLREAASSTPPILFLKLYAQCFNISFVFFGFYCLLIGNLIFRSGFLPRILGVGMAIAGLCWLVFLYPPLAQAVASWNLAGGIGELALTAWLLAFGVKRASPLT